MVVCDCLNRKGRLKRGISIGEPRCQREADKRAASWNMMRRPGVRGSAKTMVRYPGYSFSPWPEPAEATNASPRRTLPRNASVGLWNSYLQYIQVFPSVLLVCIASFDLIFGICYLFISSTDKKPVFSPLRTPGAQPVSQAWSLTSTGMRNVSQNLVVVNSGCRAKIREIVWIQILRAHRFSNPDHRGHSTVGSLDIPWNLLGLV